MLLPGAGDDFSLAAGMARVVVVVAIGAAAVAAAVASPAVRDGVRATSGRGDGPTAGAVGSRQHQDHANGCGGQKEDSRVIRDDKSTESSRNMVIGFAGVGAWDALPIVSWPDHGIITTADAAAAL